MSQTYKPCYLREDERLIRGPEIASGSYGVILKCQTSEGRECALKMITIDPQTGITEGILREIDITRRLIHPNLLHSQSYRLDSREGKVYLATELGLGDLREIMKRQGRGQGTPLSLDKRLSLLYQVVQGVAQLHRSLIAHLDIKPENVIIYCTPEGVTPEGVLSAKVIDFGLSLYVNKNLEKPYPNHVRLTLEFSPPEILRAERRADYVYSLASDIWSLAILFLEVFNERWQLTQLKEPKPRDILEAINKTFGSPEITRKSLDTILSSIDTRRRMQLVDLLSGMLSLDPRSRINIESILANPVFAGLVSTDGCQYIQPITPGPAFDVNELLLIDFIFRKSSELDLLTETVFFTIDYYYRSRFHLSRDETAEGRLSASRLLMATSFWVATKLIEPRRFKNQEVSKIFRVNEDELLKKEIGTIDAFRGIIYRQNLYNASCRVSDLVTAFNYLTLPAIYPLIDLGKWSSQCLNPESIGPLPFRSFYPKTEYYREFGSLREKELGSRLTSRLS